MTCIPTQSVELQSTNVRQVRPRSAFFIAAVAAMGGLLFGFDTGVISGALLYLRGDFNLGSLGQSFVVSSVLVGAVIGSAGAMLAGERMERRRLILGSAAVFVLGTVLATAAPSVEALVIGRGIIGLAIGLSSSVVPVYIAEIAPAARRGGFVSLFQLAITVGIFAANLVDLAFSHIHSWRWMFVIGIAPAVALWVGVLGLPESPRWLALNGHPDDAEHVLEQLNDPDPHARVREIEASISRDTTSWRILWAPFARRALAVGLGLGIFQQLIGINTVIYYAPTILEFSGFTSHTVSLLATLGIGAVNVAMTVVALLLVDRFGRRRLLMIGLVPMALTLTSIGIAFQLHSSAVKWIAIASLVGYVGAFAVSWGWGFWLLNSELYPLEVRGRGTGLVVMVQWAANLAVSLTFLPLVGAIGKPATFWIYAGLAAAAFLFTTLFVPETKGRSLEWIESFWRERVERATESEEQPLRTAA